MMVGGKTAFGSHPCQQFFKLVTSGSFAVPAEVRVGPLRATAIGYVPQGGSGRKGQDSRYKRRCLQP